MGITVTIQKFMDSHKDLSVQLLLERLPLEPVTDIDSVTRYYLILEKAPLVRLLPDGKMAVFYLDQACPKMAVISLTERGHYGVTVINLETYDILFIGIHRDNNSRASDEIKEELKEICTKAFFDHFHDKNIVGELWLGMHDFVLNS